MNPPMTHSVTFGHSLPLVWTSGSSSESQGVAPADLPTLPHSHGAVEIRAGGTAPPPQPTSLPQQALKSRDCGHVPNEQSHIHGSHAAFAPNRLQPPVTFVSPIKERLQGRGVQVLLFKVSGPKCPRSGREVNHHKFALCCIL